MDSDPQNKVIFVKVQQSFFFQLAKLQRQSAALHREIIRKLLPGKRNIKFVSSKPLRLSGKIRQELRARGALADLRDLLGPTLPAFLSPNVLSYLVEHFGIAPTTTPENDLKMLLK